jgi:YbbR domain-containing protein
MIKEFFSKNLGMKAVSLLIAIFVWFYVVVIVSPQTDIKVRNIQVAIANHQEISSRNLVLLNEPHITLDVQLRGNRSSLGTINSSNIIAMIDLAGQTEAGEVTLPIQIIIPVSDVTITSQSIEDVTITIEPIEKRTIPIVIEVKGEPSEGYEAHPPVASIQNIVIEGARTRVQLVDHANVTIDISDATSDVSVISDIELLSANDAKIESEHITVSAPQVNLTVRITPEII